MTTTTQTLSQALQEAEQRLRSGTFTSEDAETVALQSFAASPDVLDHEAVQAVFANDAAEHALATTCIRPLCPDHPTWEPPEDRSQAVLSDWGDVEYVEDIGRPGRIIVVAAEEGTGKSYAFQGELGLRLAAAGGHWAETYEVLSNGPVLVVSEMPADEDFQREEQIMASLGITRAQLAGRYFRQDLNTAAMGHQILDSEQWRNNFLRWAEEHKPIALIIDPTTSATDADAWGKELRSMFRQLRLIQKAQPQLLIILVVHMKKPQGKGNANQMRQIDAVMGEYGRLNDVTIMMQNDGNSLDTVILSVRKRVKNQRRIRLTKRGGLLVDPQPIDNAPQPKVGLDHVHDIIREHPGITLMDLATKLEVAKRTASGYVDQLVARGDITTDKGPRNTTLVYDILHIPDEE